MKQTVDLDQEIWTYEDYVKIPQDRMTHQIMGGKLFMTPCPFVLPTKSITKS